MHPFQVLCGSSTEITAPNKCRCNKCNEYFSKRLNTEIISHYEIVMYNGPHPFRKIFTQ
jgi:hypothetical protein